MSKLQSVKVFVCQRLTAAVEEIIGHLESTMTEYEEEMECHHRKLLESVSKREEEMQTADVPLHLPMKEEQQDLRPGLDQEDPVRPHVKEEQEDSWTSQEVKSQLYAIPPLQEDTSELPFTRVPVKSEDDQEKPQSSPPHRRQTDEHGEAEPPASSSAEHMETDADGADGGGSEPDRVSVPAFKCVSEPAKKTSRCSGAVSKDRDDDRKEIRKPQTDLSVVKNIVPVSDVGHDTGNKLFSCSKCGKRFGQKHHLQTHMRCHTGEKPFSCPLCGKTFSQKGNLTQHMTIHTRGKPISCSVCGEGFTQKGNLTQHMTVHRRENFVGERSTKGL